MAKLDFHKVSENENVEVYQAMSRLDTKTNKETDVAPVKYGPTPVKKVDGSALDDALALFDGYDVEAVTISKAAGIIVRVVRSKDNPYNAEPEVQRLSSKGGK